MVGAVAAGCMYSPGKATISIRLQSHRGSPSRSSGGGVTAEAIAIGVISVAE